MYIVITGTRADVIGDIHKRFDWKEINEGLTSLENKYPYEEFNFHQHIKIAIGFKDYRRALELFNSLPKEWNSTKELFWKDYSRYKTALNFVKKATKNEGSFKLHSAVIKGDIEKTIELLKDGKDLELRDKNGNTPLIVAVLYNRPAMIYVLAKAGANINVLDTKKNSLLMLAADAKLLGVAKALLEEQVDLRLTDNSGYTALHSAAGANAINIAKIIVNKDKSTVSIKNRDGMTSFIYAALKGNIDILKFLLKNNADINLSDGYKNTALHYAASNGHAEIVKFLISKNALIRPNTYGEYPKDLAAKRGYENIIKLF